MTNLGTDTQQGVLSSKVYFPSSISSDTKNNGLVHSEMLAGTEKH